LRIVEDLWAPEPPERDSVITFGKFDALHLGHQSIFDEVVRQARAVSADATVFFLHPHPMKLLDPARCPASLTSLPNKLRLLESFGVDVAIVGRFDERLRATAADAFVRHLVERFRAGSLVVGHSVRFGFRGAGDVALLQRMAPEIGFDVTTMPAQLVEGEPISSTRIRIAISAGDLSLAHRLLGRRYSVVGRVVPGEKRGRSLGFPTANVDAGDQQLPPLGIYAGETTVNGVAYASAISLGVRPTFRDTGVWLESYLLDFEGDLYGEEVEVGFGEKLRDEERFDTLDALKRQIRDDVAAVRRSTMQENRTQAS